MVIVRLIGGLGNQLFQYAAARRIAQRRNLPLKLDISGFESYKLHAYSLKHFCIREEFATPEEIAEVKGTSKKGLAKLAFRLGRKLKPYYRWSVFREPHFGPFDPNIMKTPDQVYLDGYWQSEKYFVDIQDVIRREFTVKYEQDRQSRAMAEKIARIQSVSIHVRRGDYVSNPRTNQILGTCGLDYYEQCVKRIAEQILFPHFFVFSDDPRWVTENLRLDYPATLVTHNDAARNYEDLRLMSMCKHNVIANSSFSWWGAWLNANPTKIVIAPRKWFNAPSLDDRDLLPDGWVRV